MHIILTMYANLIARPNKKSEKNLKSSYLDSTLHRADLYKFNKAETKSLLLKERKYGVKNNTIFKLEDTVKQTVLKPTLLLLT